MRRISDTVNSKTITGILHAIEKAAKAGDYQTWWYKDMSELDRNVLIDLGYKVGETMFDRNEVLTNIQWTQTLI